MSWHQKKSVFKPIFLLFLGLMAIFPMSVFAQNQSSSGIDISVSPPIQYLHLKPDSANTVNVSVKNESDRPLTITPKLVSFIPVGGTGQIEPQSNNQFPYLVINTQNWKLNQATVLQPQQEVKLELLITIPKQVNEEEHHLTLLFQTSSLGGDQSSTAAVTGATGSNLVVFISDQDMNQGDLTISQLEVPKIIDSFGWVHAQVAAKNVGKNSTPITGRYQLVAANGKIITEHIFYPDMVLANSYRNVRGLPSQQVVDWETAVLDPETLANLASDFSFKPTFLFGRYDVVIEIGKARTVQTIFAVPISPIIGIIALLIGYWILKKVTGKR